MPIRTHHDLKRLPREELSLFVAENVRHLLEEEVLAVIANPYVSTPILQTIAQNQRLIGFYSVRLRLVAHRATPQAHAVKLVHYLYWPDLLRISTDVQVPSTVRRAIDTQLLLRVDKLTLGEKIASARVCSHALIKALLFDPDPKVFASLLINQRLREDDLILVAGSAQATAEQLAMLGSDYKWSHRYAIRKALVLNPRTPRAAAASQLRHLTKRDLAQIAAKPDTSVYLRRCIERLVPAGGGTARAADFSAPAGRIE
jgi:hypothetical protein